MSYILMGNIPSDTIRAADAVYKIIDNEHAVLIELLGAPHSFKVPGSVFSQENKKYTITGIMIKDDELKIDILSFDNSSEVMFLSIFHIGLCSSICYLPPKIKRIQGPGLMKARPKIIYDNNNKFISIFGKIIIANNYPLEIAHKLTSKKREYIRETVKIISCYGFNESIVSVVIPSSVEVINKFAFFCCKILRFVKFKGKSRLNRIGLRAFQGTAIESIEIPSSVEIIGEEAFASMTNLTTVTFGQNSKLNTIKKGTFRKTSIVSIVVPSNVMAIEEEAFESCQKLKSVTFEKGSKIITIKKNVFTGSTIESIEIPSSVQFIEPSALKDNNNLRCVTFMNNSSLNLIRESTFKNTAIESIEIPSSVRNIGHSTFKHCKKLKSVTFAKNSKLQLITLDSFSDTAVESIVIPAGVKLVKGDKNGDNHVKVTIDKSNKFVSTTKKRSILLNHYPLHIIYQHTCKKHLYIRETVGSICYGAYANNLNLISVVIPASVCILSRLAFSKCSNLRFVTFNGKSKLIVIEKNAFQHTALESIEIPSSVIRIREYAFNFCENLKSITFQENSLLKFIGHHVFQKTFVNSIEIPSSVEVIEGGVFRGCTSLEYVVFPSDSRLKKIKRDDIMDGLLGINNGPSDIDVQSIPSCLGIIVDCIFVGCPLKSIKYGDVVFTSNDIMRATESNINGIFF